MYFDESPYILNKMSTRKQPSRQYHYKQGKATRGMSWGRHRVAQHTGHVLVNNRELLSFACCLKTGKRALSCVFRSFVFQQLNLDPTPGGMV